MNLLQIGEVISTNFKQGGIKAVFTDLLNFFGKEDLAAKVAGLGSKLSGLAGPIAIAVAAIASLSSSYGGLGGVLKRVGQVFTDAIKGIRDFADKIGFSDKIEKLKDAFGHLVEPLKRIYDVLGLLKPV